MLTSARRRVAQTFVAPSLTKRKSGVCPSIWRAGRRWFARLGTRKPGCRWKVARFLMRRAPQQTAERERPVSVKRMVLLALVLLTGGLLTPAVLPAQTLDQYGGYTDLPAPGGATGFFRVATFGNRWMLVTPSGTGSW